MEWRSLILRKYCVLSWLFCMPLGFCDGEGRRQNFIILSKANGYTLLPKHDLEQTCSLLHIYS